MRCADVDTRTHGGEHSHTHLGRTHARIPRVRAQYGYGFWGCFGACLNPYPFWPVPVVPQTPHAARVLRVRAHPHTGTDAPRARIVPCSAARSIMMRPLQEGESIGQMDISVAFLQSHLFPADAPPRYLGLKDPVSEKCMKDQCMVAHRRRSTGRTPCSHGL